MKRPQKIEQVKYTFTHINHRTADQLKIMEIIEAINYLLEREEGGVEICGERLDNIKLDPRKVHYCANPKGKCPLHDKEEVAYIGGADFGNPQSHIDEWDTL